MPIRMIRDREVSVEGEQMRNTTVLEPLGFGSGMLIGFLTKSDGTHYCCDGTCRKLLRVDESVIERTMPAPHRRASHTSYWHARHQTGLNKELRQRYLVR